MVLFLWVFSVVNKDCTESEGCRNLSKADEKLISNKLLKEVDERMITVTADRPARFHNISVVPKDGVWEICPRL